MENALKSNEWLRICVYKTFKIEIQKGWPNNSDFLQNWLYPQIAAPPLHFLEISWLIENFSKNMQNALRSNDSQWIWVRKAFKTEIQKGGPNNSDSLTTGWTQKLGPPSLICRNFKTHGKVLTNHAECIEI